MGVWCVSPPTDFTDLHRWLGCVSPPTEFTEFTEVLLRRSSHGIHGIHRSFVASVLPRNSRNSQKFGCVSPPTEFTEFTEVCGCCWLRGYGRMPYPPNLCASVPICGRYFSARRFCVFRAFCGNIVSHGFHGSTQMVGCVNSPTEFTEFTEVLGCCWQRGYGRMPYPPTSVRIRANLWEELLCQKVPCVLCVLWKYSLPRISQINTDGWLR